jgi:hypothetical protein
MINVDMSSMPPKVIKRENCLWARSLWKLSKDPGPRKLQTLEREMSQMDLWGFKHLKKSWIKKKYLGIYESRRKRWNSKWNAPSSAQKYL